MDFLTFPGTALSWITAISVILGGVWALAGNEVRDTVRGWVLQAPIANAETLESNIVEMREFRAEMRGMFADLSQQVTDLDRRLSEVEPPPVFAIWDTVRSRIEEPCPQDGLCRYTMRVKRTPIAASCTATNLRLFVVDSLAQRWAVTLIDPAIPVQATADEFIRVQGVFALPEEAAPGVAEFFTTYDYVDCAGDEPGVTHPQRTPSLIFTVKRP